MRRAQRSCRHAVVVWAVALGAGAALGGAPSPAHAAQQAGGETDERLFQRVCTACHAPQPGRRDRNEWAGVINSMMDLGAKVTDDEYKRVLNYLTTTAGRSDAAAAPAQERPTIPRASPEGARRTQQAGGGKGPNDRMAVDSAAAERGRRMWAAECITCHGTYGRGSDNGPSLMRSALVIRNRNGDQLGPFLKKGHTLQSGRPGSALVDEQIVELSHFLAQRILEVLSKGTPTRVINGDAAAGKAFFHGEDGCTACHSPTGNLAGIGGKYDAFALQQRLLFPMSGQGRTANPIRVTVALPNGEKLSGALVEMNDFTVTVRDGSGIQRTVRRTPTMRIEKSDPLQRHIALLETITDKQIHDVVEYLETLR